jgi:hypothetical protein
MVGRHFSGDSGKETLDRDDSGSEEVVTAAGAELQVQAGVAVGQFRRAHPGSRWGSVMTFRYPLGIERHPRVLDRVENEIGRICAIDTGDDGVRVSFGLRGQCREEATVDCEAIATRLLGVLGLSDNSLVEALVIDRDADTAPYPPLSAVPGQD